MNKELGEKEMEDKEHEFEDEQEQPRLKEVTDVTRVEGKPKTAPEPTGELLQQDRSVVVPGELLATGMGFIPSDGAYRDGEAVRSNLMGLLSIKGRVLRVIPLSGRYLPQPGDVVIGVVSEVKRSAWTIDLNSPFMGILAVAEAVDRYVDVNKEDLSKYFAIGETILAEVGHTTDVVHLSMRGPGLRKLTDGQIVDVAPAKVPRVIGKNGSMVTVIRDGTGVNMLVGRNGKIWLKGEREQIKKSLKAINMIDKESHTHGLTDKVREMLQLN
jgi:exosome complex component RRP4